MTSRLPQMGGRRPISYNDIEDITTVKGVIDSVMTQDQKFRDPTNNDLRIIDANIQLLDIDQCELLLKFLDKYIVKKSGTIIDSFTSSVKKTINKINKRMKELNIFSFNFIKTVIDRDELQDLEDGKKKILENNYTKNLTLIEISELLTMLENKQKNIYEETNTSNMKLNNLKQAELAEILNLIKTRKEEFDIYGDMFTRNRRNVISNPDIPPSVFTYNPVPPVSARTTPRTTPRTTLRKDISYILNTIKFSKTAPEPTSEFLDTIKQNIESIGIDDLDNIKSLLETYNRGNWPEINESVFKLVSDTLQSVNDRLVKVYTKNTLETFKYIQEILYVYTTKISFHVQQIIKTNGWLEKLSLNDLKQVKGMIKKYLETNGDSDKGKLIKDNLLLRVNSLIDTRKTHPRPFNPKTEMPVKPPSVFTYNPVPVNAPSSFSFVPVNPLMEDLKKAKHNLEKEKDELISSNTRLEAEKKDLEAEKIKLELTNKSSNSRIADLAIEIVGKEEKIQMNKQTIDSLNSEIAQLNARIKDLESENEALQKEVEKSKLQLNELFTTNELINQELKKLKSENKSLLKGINEEIVKMEESKLMSKTTSEFIDSLQVGINELTKKIEINNKQIETLNEEKLSNSEQIETLKKELEQLTSVNTSLKAQISKLEAGLEQGTTTLAEIEKEKSKLQSELEEKTKELENLKTNLPKEFLQVYNTKKYMQEKFNVRENGYKENIKLLRIDISDLKSKIDEYSNIEKELRSINSAIQEKLEAAKLENKQLSNENTGLKDRLKKLKQSLETKLIEKINKIKEMELDNEREKENESIELKKLQDKLSLSNLDLDDAKRQIALHVGKETSNNAQLEQLNSTIQTLKAEISQLKSELENKRVLIIKENNTGLLNQKKELENMLQKLNTQIVFSKHELSSINEEINKHEHKVFTSVNKGNYKLRENEYNHEYNRIERIIRNVREVTISSNLSCQRGTLANRSNTKCVKISY